MPQTATTFHHDIAADFADKYRTHPAFRERYAVWAALLDAHIQPGSRVADLGCGSGVFSFYLAKKGCRITGIDGAENMVALCRAQQQKLGLSNLNFYCQNLPLESQIPLGQQDAIISSSVLEYLDDLPGLLQNVSDLLAPGGIFIASMPNLSSVYRQLERIVFRLTGRPAYYRFVRHVVTEAAFAKQLAAYGFRLKTTRYYAGYPWLRVVLPERMGCNLFVAVFEKTETAEAKTA